jgi:hypothetical protein
VRGLIARAAVGGITTAVLLAAAPLPGLSADRVLRYSGRVERVELVEGLVVVDELAARGASRRHEVHVNPDTPIVTAARLRPWEMRGTGAYVEVPVSLVDMLAGDFVVVESVEAEGRAVVQRITIIESARRATAR